MSGVHAVGSTGIRGITARGLLGRWFGRYEVKVIEGCVPAVKGVLWGFLAA
jgi:hypothetical protein